MRIITKSLPKFTDLKFPCQPAYFIDSPSTVSPVLGREGNTVVVSRATLKIQPDGTTVISSISKDELFAHAFAKNAILNDSGPVPPSSPPPYAYFTLPVKIHHSDVFHALAEVRRRKILKCLSPHNKESFYAVCRGNNRPLHHKPKKI
ncbi:hypothetical protein E2C01_064793 [Portunus trituberculatus]|uniref:Uncharacterized protein n=1 Tax=Portunus trituberculatus TaxID=210409 RepID=A0A5B7HCR8_PORTR|nr:hypothetical protein [Portunus trituberculatus]